MSLYLRLAWRNIWRHRRRTVIVVLAIGFTMGMMMMYDGLIGGFQQAIYGNAIKVLGETSRSTLWAIRKKRLRRRSWLWRMDQRLSRPPWHSHRW